MFRRQSSILFARGLVDKRSGDNKVISNVFLIDMHYQNPLGPNIPFAEGKLNKHYSDRYIKYFSDAGCTVTSTFVQDIKTEDDWKNLDFTAEKKKWKQADLVVLQTPVWWFSLPWGSKRYLDEVFTRAMDPKDEWCLCVSDGRNEKNPEDNYATGGSCSGRYMMSFTSNAPQGAYHRDVNAGPLKNKGVEDVFLNMMGNFQFIGMTQIPGSTFQAYDVVKNPKFEDDQKRFEENLNGIFDTKSE